VRGFVQSLGRRKLNRRSVGKETLADLDGLAPGRCTHFQHPGSWRGNSKQMERRRDTPYVHHSTKEGSLSVLQALSAVDADCASTDTESIAVCRCASSSSAASGVHTCDGHKTMLPGLNFERAMDAAH